MTSNAALLALAASLLVLACGDGESAPPSPTVEAAPSSVPAATPDTQEPRFDVRVEAPARAPVGRESLAKVHVEPRKPWHMNTAFPVALRVEATGGVTLEVLRQRKDDAERFDDDGLVFALPFTPTSDGPKTIAAEVDFAVCGDAACAPETVPVDFTFEGGCDGDALC